MKRVTVILKDYIMKTLEIVNTLQQRAARGEQFADQLLADAIRASNDADWAGLAFIANIVAGQPGDTVWVIGDLMAIADILSPL
jgi:hypothetical protein